MRRSATHDRTETKRGDPKGSPGIVLLRDTRRYWIGSILMSPFVAVTFTFKPASRNRL